MNFFVRIPSRLRRDSLSDLVDEPGGCGATRTVQYTLLDQTGQIIDTDASVKEVLSAFSAPPGVKPVEAAQENFVVGRLADGVGYGIPQCPGPFYGERHSDVRGDRGWQIGYARHGERH